MMKQNGNSKRVMRVTMTSKKPPLQRIPTKESLLQTRKDRAESANRQKISINGELLHHNGQMVHRASFSEKSDGKFESQFDTRSVKKINLSGD